MRTSLVIAVVACAHFATAQIPSLGWCPDYQPMANFDMNRFLGQWHEAERYFTVTELGSRCVTTNYEKMPDGRVWVSNEIRNTFTGVKRVLDGQLTVVGRDGEGKLSVKYTSLPVPYDTQYSVLDTDYTTYAVIWSCSGIGPVHTQNAWVMTRERLAPGLVLQRAYGVLDKYKISRAFFVKTNQDDCTVQATPVEAVDPTPQPAAAEKEKGKDAGSVTVEHEYIEEKSAAAPKEEIEKPAAASVPGLILSHAKNAVHDIKPEAEKVEEKHEKVEPAAPEKHDSFSVKSGISPVVAAKPEEPVKPASDPAEQEKPQEDAPKPVEAEKPSHVKPELKKSDSKKVEKHVEHKISKPVAEVSKAEP